MDTRDPPPGSAAALQQHLENQHKPTPHELMEDARKQGVPAFEFPPDATPGQKAAEARKVRFALAVIV
jgi:hypothetical protein